MSADSEIILIHGPTGNAYKLEKNSSDAVGTSTWLSLLCAPLLADGSIEKDGNDYNWGEVDFSRGLDEEQTKECRAIEAVLILVQP